MQSIRLRPASHTRRTTHATPAASSLFSADSRLTRTSSSDISNQHLAARLASVSALAYSVHRHPDARSVKLFDNWSLCEVPRCFLACLCVQAADGFAEDTSLCWAGEHRRSRLGSSYVSHVFTGFQNAYFATRTLYLNYPVFLQQDARRCCIV